MQHLLTWRRTTASRGPSASGASLACIRPLKRGVRISVSAWIAVIAATLSPLRTCTDDRRSVVQHRLGRHAVVIGGSLTGLMTARVLADHCDAVTVLARDSVAARHPTLHTSIPQGHPLHGLLLGGLQGMAARDAGCIAPLETRGAVRCRLGRDPRGLSPHWQGLLVYGQGTRSGAAGQGAATVVGSTRRGETRAGWPGSG